MEIDREKFRDLCLKLCDEGRAYAECGLHGAKTARIEAGLYGAWATALGAVCIHLAASEGGALRLVFEALTVVSLTFAWLLARLALRTGAVSFWQARVAQWDKAKAEFDIA